MTKCVGKPDGLAIDCPVHSEVADGIPEPQAVLRIEVLSHDDGFEVVIPDEDGNEFARTFARSPDAALQAAGSYVACVFNDMLNPDPRLTALKEARR